MGYYRMQSMNQSLIALLCHGVISYDEAEEQSPDPEDLSLKMRKMFPNLMGQSLGQGEEDVSSNDFSEIQELQQFKRLYEEQEEKIKLRIGEKDEEIERMQSTLSERDQMIREQDERMNEMREEAEKMRADYGRLRDEAQQKIDKLMDRIKELNQRLVQDEKKGIFR